MDVTGSPDLSSVRVVRAKSDGNIALLLQGVVSMAVSPVKKPRSGSTVAPVDLGYCTGIGMCPLEEEHLKAERRPRGLSLSLPSFHDLAAALSSSFIGGAGTPGGGSGSAAVSPIESSVPSGHNGSNAAASKIAVTIGGSVSSVAGRNSNESAGISPKDTDKDKKMVRHPTPAPQLRRKSLYSSLPDWTYRSFTGVDSLMAVSPDISRGRKAFSTTKKPGFFNKNKNRHKLSPSNDPIEENSNTGSYENGSAAANVIAIDRVLSNSYDNDAIYALSTPLRAPQHADTFRAGIVGVGEDVDDSSGSNNDEQVHKGDGDISSSSDSNFIDDDDDVVDVGAESLTFKQEIENLQMNLCRASSIRARNGLQRRFIIVDSDPNSRKQVEKMLSQEGQAVSTAVDGLDCLVNIEESKRKGEAAYDVILVDLDHLLFCGGPQLAKTLRTEGFKNLIIGVTASEFKVKQHSQRQSSSYTPSYSSSPYTPSYSSSSSNSSSSSSRELPSLYSSPAAAAAMQKKSISVSLSLPLPQPLPLSQSSSSVPSPVPSPVASPVASPVSSSSTLSMSSPTPAHSPLSTTTVPVDRKKAGRSVSFHFTVEEEQGEKTNRNSASNSGPRRPRAQSMNTNDYTNEKKNNRIVLPLGDSSSPSGINDDEGGAGEEVEEVEEEVVERGFDHVLLKGFSIDALADALKAADEAAASYLNKKD